jgi:hypothetical protein
MGALFFYGTLMDADLRQLVAGRRIETLPAWLSGFRRVPVAGRDYPMLTAAPSHVIEGVYAASINRASRERLCRYEGREYRVGSVTVVLSDGLPRKAGAFMALPGVPGDLRKDWDFEAWRNKSKKKLISLMLAGSG